MRPRVFPAEDAQVLEQVERVEPASMRPRVFPAEDAFGRRSRPPGDLLASMRPRVFPAEDTLSHADHLVRIPASMRPRVFPAEDFLPPLVYAQSAASASMRPRVFPAEDSPPLARRTRSGRRFNEAAGIPRGRPSPASGKPTC